MNYIKLTILVIITFIVQTTVVGYLRIIDISPNLVFVVVLILALFVKDYMTSIIISTSLGILTDFMSSGLFGINTLLFMFFSLGVCFIAKQFMREKLLVSVCLVIVGTFIFENLYYVFNLYYFGFHNYISVLYQIIFPITIYNAIIVFIVYPVVKKMCILRI